MVRRAPTVPFPAPQAGVVVSEHPKNVGVTGLRNALNVVDRNGILQVRDGQDLFEVLEDTASADPVLGIISLDVQDYGVTEENRLHYLTDDAFQYKDDGTWKTASTKTDDWGTDLVGPNAADVAVVTDRLHVEWKNTIQWDDIDAESSETAKYLRIEVDYDAGAGIGGSWSAKLHVYYGAGPNFSVDASTFTISSVDMVDTVIGGVGYQFDDGATHYSGVFIVWDNNDMEDIRYRLGAPTAGDAEYNQLIVNGARYGMPNGGSLYAGLDRDATAQWAAWDYGQVTHVIGAVGVDKGYVFEFHDSAGALDTKIQACGEPGVCPKAECVAVAGQRLVAGNIAFIDSVETIDNMGWDTINDAVDYASYPDGIIYSGTVLTGGHKTWYPTDIIRLADTPGQIKAVKAMGMMMVAVYKTDAIYILAVQSGLAAFRPDLRATGIKGPVGRNAVAAISDNLHIYLGEDGGLYVFDGSTPRSIGEQFRAWIGREMDSDYSNRSYLHFDSFKNELHVYYPHKGSGGVVRRGLIVSMDKQPYRGWSVEYPARGYHSVSADVQDMDLPCMAAHWESGPTRSGDIMGHSWPAAGVPDGTDTSLYSEILFGTQYAAGDAQLLKLVEGKDDGQDSTEGPIYVLMRSGLTDFGDPERQKIALEIEWLFDRVVSTEACPLIARLYGGQTNTEYELLDTCTEIDLTDYPPYVSEFREQSRYFAYELEFNWYSPRPGGVAPTPNFDGALASIAGGGRRRQVSP